MMPAPVPAAGGLPEPETAAGQAGLAALLHAPERSLIALDYDGTLAPIVPDPAAAHPQPGAVAALSALAARAGTLAVITGRPALAAINLGGLDQVPGLIVLGHYGRQRWQSGMLDSPPPPRGMATARAELPSVLAAAGAPAGTWTEDKGDALAVHTRRTAEPVRALHLLAGPLAGLAGRTGLIVEPGRLVIELRAPGPDKGMALEKLAAERSPAAILFCGDDLGDRPAFEAVRALRASGTPGLAVCSSSAEVAGLGQLADLVVDGPPGVVRLLAGLAEALDAA